MKIIIKTQSIILILASFALFSCGGGGGGNNAGAPPSGNPGDNPPNRQGPPSGDNPPPPDDNQPPPPDDNQPPPPDDNQPPPQDPNTQTPVRVPPADPSASWGTRPPIPQSFSSLTAPSEQERAPFRNHLQYQLDNGLQLIKVDYLYAAALKNSAMGYGPGTGRGITLGLISSGVDHTHPVLRDQIDTASSLTYALPSIPSTVAGDYVVTAETPSTLTLKDGQSEVEAIRRYPTFDCNPPDALNCVRVLTRADGSKRELPLAAKGLCASAPFRPPCRGYHTRQIQPGIYYLEKGTEMAAIMAGARLENPAEIPLGSSSSQSVYTHGVAYEGKLLAYTMRSNERVGDAKDLNNEALFASAFRFHNARAQVVAVGFYPLSEYDSAAAAQKVESAGVLEALEQKTTAPWERTVYVFAAGFCLHPTAYLGNPNEGCVIAPNGFQKQRPGPYLWAALPAKFPDRLRTTHDQENMRDHILTVVSLNQSGRIGEFSRKCGAAKDFCLAAPGHLLWTTRPIYTFSGGQRGPSTARTSHAGLAAAHVAGAIAALMSYFGDQMGHDEIVMRVLRTANKDGIYANTDFYGQGLLDLEAAAKPLGNLQIPTGQAVRGQSESAVHTGLLVGGAYGDAFARAFGARHLMMLDGLDAPFPLPLAELVQALAPRAQARAYDELLFPILRRHHRSANGAHLSMSAPPAASNPAESAADEGAYFLSAPLPDDGGRLVSGYGVHAAHGFAPSASDGMLPHSKESFLPPWLGFARGAHVGVETKNLQILGFEDRESYGRAALPDAPPASLRGFMLGLRHETKRSAWASQWQFGFVRETGARHDSIGGGALRLTGAHDTWFVGGSNTLSLWQGWRGLISGYVGITQARGAQSESLFAALGPMVSSQFALALVRPHLWRKHDQLSLYVAQPLRVESGRASLLLPQRRTAARQVMQERLAFDLAPSGRTTEWGVQYTRRMGGGEMALGAALVQEPGHTRGIEPQAQMMLRYQYRL